MQKILLISLLSLLIVFSITAADNSSDNKIKSGNLSPLNISGVVMLSTGITSTITGIALFILDDRISLQVSDKDSYNDYPFTRTRLLEPSWRYGIFAASLALMFTGGIVIAASIPMMVYKKKKISLDFNAAKNITVAVSYKF